MAPSTKKPISKDPNLTRIRDNQRRSRARRKEYLSELEEKLSKCERAGVEVNVEIQTAARRVLEENRRLRNLLQRYGIETEVSAGNELEGLLERRRACGSGTETSSMSPEVNGEGKIALPRLAALGPPRSAVPTPPASSASPAGIPESRSSVEAAPSIRKHAEANEAHDAMHFERQDYEIQPPTSEPMTTDTTPNGQGYDRKDYETNHPPITAGTTPTSQAYEMQPTAPLSRASTLDSSQNINSPALGPNCSSCKSVASAIRSIRPDIGAELEVDLGCRDAEDCSVPNMQAFDVIDRYSGEAA